MIIFCMVQIHIYQELELNNSEVNEQKDFFQNETIDYLAVGNQN